VPEPPSLRIQERFVSIQGEGILAGVPSSFVRVSGCNLRCVWCDSPASSWAPVGEQVGLDVLESFCHRGPRHVVLTGGEPLLFREVAELASRLSRAGHHVTVETAATTWMDGLTCDLVSLSPKLAHSTPRGRALPTWVDRHEARRWQPAVVRRLMSAFEWQLKLVVRALDRAALDDDVREVEVMLDALEVSGRDRERVLLMPECVDASRLGDDYARLAPVCQERGFRVGPRLHITAFGHTPGT
jgi:7-carboxy-7-deazaguanine synthase